MARRQVVVCDICGDVTKATTRYRVSSEGRHVVVDLCGQHSKFLEELLAQGEARTSGSASTFEAQVTTLEALEERKRAAKAEAEKE